MRRTFYPEGRYPESPWRALTCGELLTALTVLGVLGAVLAPLAGQARVKRTARSGGLAALHRLAHGLALYTQDYEPAPFSALVFSRTTGFRHSSIPNGIAAVRRLGEMANFSVDASEDPALFTEDNLSNYQVVLFLCTTGNILNSDQKSAFERYIENGGGFVGIHSASDTEYDWPWYGGLVGAYFKNHPNIQQATAQIVDPDHPSTVSLPAEWGRTDEWYNFRTNPRGAVHVLVQLDETSYRGGEMNFDHPISWCQDYDGGRSWYTAMGHTETTYAEALFLDHLLGGIQSAAGVVDADCSPN